MAPKKENVAAPWPAGVVSLQVVRSAQVEAQRLARERLRAEQEGIQAEIDVLLGRLMRLQHDFERCFSMGAPSVGAMNGRA